MLAHACNKVLAVVKARRVLVLSEIPAHEYIDTAITETPFIR